ncbi:MAG TPA: sulfatase-like hydrolase/transferase [Bryobacteraceae bacterium]|nr:sulfatase-like hydrolase/transferase [Bryobacteraceae bacterium]
MPFTRKRFLQLAAAAPALPAVSGFAAEPAGHRPNILLIMTDQHRRNYMTAAGNSIVPTPNIDRIASRGVRFTNAICPYPVCAASRASLLSGLHAHTTGVINNTDLLPWNTPTIAHHFAGLGYHTGLIGKMHFNDGHTHGFQYFLGFNDWFMYLGPKVQCYADEIANHPIGPRFFETVNDDGSGLPELPSVWGGKRPWAGHVKRMGLVSELDPGDQFDAFVARESCRFLERYGQQPFLLVSSFLKPHPPLHPPEPWAAHYPIDRMELPPISDVTQYPRWIQRRIDGFQRLGPERLREHRAGYLGNLAYVDTCVGDLYKCLERLNLVDNTIVVYTADHGEMDGDHGLYQKFCLFDPSVGVPLIVSHPGKLPENKTSDALVEYFGIFPTLAELTGAPAPRNIEARSFANLARDPSARGPEAIFSEYNLRSNTDCYMVRTKSHKYIYNHADIPELYDLEADPGEKTNRGADPSLARLRSQLHDRLVAWYDPARNPYRPHPKE